MRGFLVFVGIVVGIFIAWNSYLYQGGLLRKLDAKPGMKNAPALLFYLGRYHEAVGRKELAVEAYGRIVQRYPKSTYADDAQYGVACSYEEMKKRPEAIQEYEKYLEMYPNGVHATVVKNNVYLLKGG